LGGSRERMARGLRKALAGGWARVVLVRPRDGEERVIERGEPSKTGDGEVVGRIDTLARDGFVKVTVVVDEHLRITMDARHGSATVHRDAGQTPTEGDGAQAGDTPSPALLRAIGLANTDGTISAQNAKKLKQVRHLVELLRPAWTAAVTGSGRALRIVDCAAGNAYVSFVLADAAGRQVDIHPLRLDEHGGWQEQRDGSEVLWSREALAGRGRIGDREVRCTSPEFEVRSHLYPGYDDIDRQDAERLCERFGIERPSGSWPGTIHPKRVRARPRA
jgi:hypothetical protein